MDLEHSFTTPAQIIRRLSHSKIIVNCPIIGGDKSNKNQTVDLISIEDPEDPEDSPLEIRNKSLNLLILKKLPCGKYLGLILALLASLTMSSVTLIVKTMPQYHPFSVVVWRLQGILYPSIILMSYLRTVKKEPIFDSFMPLRAPGKWIVCLLLVLRGVFGCSADIFQYYSLQYLSLADSSVISSSSPVFVTFVAYFALGEKCGIVSILTGVMSLFGVLIITRPPILTGEEAFDTQLLIGNGLALGCMLMATLTFVTIRSLRHVHLTLATFSLGFFGTLECIGLCLTISTFDLPEGVHDWLLAVAIASLYFLGQIFFTLALQLEDAGPVSLVRSCDVIFAYLWQFIFLNVVPDGFSVIGGSIVLLSVLLQGFRKWLQELPEKDSRREIFRIILS